MLKLIFISFICISPLFAYLDPGSGSMLLYFIMGIFASLIYYFKGIIYKIRAFFSSGKADKGLRNLDGIDILFYSEGGQYWNVYKPIIDELEKLKIKSAYYTSKKNDPVFKTDYKYLKKAFIGEDLVSFTILNNIKVKLFITTTPQLDVMQLKRSKDVEEYIHIFHSPIDTLMYKYFSFDFFDTVMCSGKYQIESIKELETIRKTKPKELLETGLTYFDVLKERKEELEKTVVKNNKKTILVAPTWKDGNLLEKYEIKPLVDLVNLGYEVILRPHPQMYTSKKDIMQKIEDEIKNISEISIDKNPSGEIAMSKADLLISDLSGIIFDFYFVFEKPVIVIKDVISKDGKEVDFSNKEPWEIENLEKVATIIDLEDIENIQKYIEIATLKTTQQSIEEFRKASLFNYGLAAKVATNQIIAKIKG
ncbi:CDP-glycerol glycerophosphotransferase family protein [Aliarcobacter cryaerophilus]|uniref:CDP-glycerol glycerophosphotransferase family protein n=1 Tax=Aliarcobacter cryaerophilus TaxID=28198 RepID=UPI0021B44853|nr:CDP-glycerol glycerophosphotransferase family protein [Aliarcobacter cryaerophilus]MCT7523248.1 CDP-glycerol glycerophosphotransferase family protein [Aliarcobacter cryaerophilus]